MQNAHKSCTAELVQLKKALGTAQSTVYTLQDKTNSLERYSRRNNMRLVGIEETTGEDPMALVKAVLCDDFEMESPQVERAHRVGKPRQIDGKKTRHIIFKLRHFDDKLNILRKKWEVLKDKPHYIVDDLTDADLEAKQRLKPVMDEARRQKKTVKFSKGDVYINGALYRPQPNTEQAQANG